MGPLQINRSPKLEKTNEQPLRYLKTDQRTDQQMDQQTDGQGRLLRTPMGKLGVQKETIQKVSSFQNQDNLISSVLHLSLPFTTNYFKESYTY